MSSRPCAKAGVLRGPLLALLALPILGAGCFQFEEPLPQLDDAEVDPSQKDATVSADAAEDGDVGDDAETVGELDASVADAGPDAAPDAALQDAGKADAMVPIPKRPTLAKCNFGAPVNVAQVMSAGLNEISGLAVSQRNPQIVWMIEDSGNGAAVHAVNHMGELKASFSVAGAGIDIEDIAVGPGPTPGVSYLYIADIGDNSASRAHVTIVRAPEPQVGWDQTFASSQLLNADPLNFNYPFGSQNAEALMVDLNQDLYIVTKNGFSAPNTLCRLAAPQIPVTLRTLEVLGPVYAGLTTDNAITSGDISKDGKHIMLRSLHSAQHWTRSGETSIADTILKGTACDAELSTAEGQGESVGFSDTGYFTISEGANEWLHFVSFSK